MAAAATLDDPIFIVGTVRSGTTILAACLDQHPMVRWVRDSGLELAESWFASSRVSFGVPNLVCEHCPPAGAEDLSPARIEAVRELFTKLLREGALPGKTRFLNKNPHLWNKLKLLRTIFPKARLIITSRDIRSTVTSTQFLWMRLHKQQNVLHYLPPAQGHCWSCLAPERFLECDPARTFPGGDITVLAEYWLRAYETVETAIGEFDDPLLVRHRDLVDHLDETLERIYRRVGVCRLGRSPDVKIDAQRNQRWQKLLTAGEQARLGEWIEQHRDRIIKLRYADITL